MPLRAKRALDSTCLTDLPELQPVYVQSFTLTLDYGVKLGATR